MKKLLSTLLVSTLTLPGFSQLMESVELNDYIDPNYRKYIAGDSVNFLNFIPSIG